MKKLLFNFLILIALLHSSYSFSNGQYNADAAALTRSASDNGLALNQSTRGLVNKLNRCAE